MDPDRNVERKLRQRKLDSTRQLDAFERRAQVGRLAFHVQTGERNRFVLGQPGSIVAQRQFALDQWSKVHVFSSKIEQQRDAVVGSQATDRELACEVEFERRSEIIARHRIARQRHFQVAAEHVGKIA